MDGLFTVIPVNGAAICAADIDTDSLRYDGLTWTEAVELCRLSFLQGFECIIFKTQTNEAEGGGGDCEA